MQRGPADQTSASPATSCRDSRLPRAALLYFFFFYRYGDHRDLHSFPTRRSSDLTPTAGVLVDALGSSLQLEDAAHRAVEERDRKSTRLNSSHVKISYAVFCLK